jgi:hypothetical protein
MLRRSGGVTGSANSNITTNHNDGSVTGGGGHHHSHGQNKGWQQQGASPAEPHHGHGHGNDTISSSREENLHEVDNYFAHLFVGDEPGGGGRQTPTPTNDMHVYPSNDNTNNGGIGIIDSTTSASSVMHNQQQQNHHHKSPLPSMAYASSSSGYGHHPGQGQSYPPSFPSYSNKKDFSSYGEAGDGSSPTTVNRHNINIGVGNSGNIGAVPVPQINHYNSHYNNGNGNGGVSSQPPSPPRQHFQSIQHAPHHNSGANNRYAGEMRGTSPPQLQQQQWQGDQSQPQQQQQFHQGPGQHNNNASQYPPQQQQQQQQHQHQNSSGYGHVTNSNHNHYQVRPSPSSGGPPLLRTLVAEPLMKVRNFAMSFLANHTNARGANIGRQKKQDDHDRHHHGDLMPGTAGSAINETLASDNWMSGLLAAPTPPPEPVNGNGNTNAQSHSHPMQGQNSASSRSSNGNGNTTQSSSSSSSREGMAMVGLVLLLFVGLNMSSLMSAEESALTRMRQGRGRFGRNKNNKSVHHEEGMDRPNSIAYIKSVRGRGRGSGGSPQAPAHATSTESRKNAWGAPRPIGIANKEPPKQRQQLQQPPVPQLPPQAASASVTADKNNNDSTGNRPNANNPANFAVDQLISKAAPPQKPPQPPPVAVVQQQPPPPPQQPSGPQLPPVFDSVATVGKGPNFPPVAVTDIPMFWHIPKAGGSSIKEILGTCMGFTLGCELGGDPQHASTTTLQTFEVARRNVVNIDFYNPQGIQTAKSLNVAASGKLDVLVSPYLHQSASLFTPANQGRLFTLLRHPVDRALSSYGNYLLVEKQAQSTPMGLLDYAKSNRIENNWMTRFLSGKMAGPLEDSDLEMAKLLLKTKFIVGLLDQKEEFLQRLNMYFGWNGANAPALQKSKLDPTTRHQCIQQHLAAASPSNQFSSQKSPLVEGTTEHTLLLVQNSFDMQLYDYAKELFKEQRSLFV